MRELLEVSRRLLKYMLGMVSYLSPEDTGFLLEGESMVCSFPWFSARSPGAAADISIGFKLIG